MANLKAITGHTSARGVMRYLERGGRALARDFLNLAPPVAGEGPGGLPEHGPYDWAAAMDATRAAAGNDLPWRGRAARTWKHYVISPDPRNGVSLDELRELATAWARRWFPDCEVAVVYHDDNAGRIPHAHVVVNNTVLSTGRRLQVPDPLELNRSLQRMEAERGFAHRYSNERAGSGRGRPRTAQRVHVRRAEREIAARGGRSWVADIRGRVEAARAVSRREGEFRSALAAMGVELSDASPRGGRRDWVYSLAGTPSRRVRGEGLGLDYGRAAIEARWAGSAPPALPREEVERVARSALEVGDLAELDELARAVGALERYRVRGAADLERRAGALEARGDAAGAAALRGARELFERKGVDIPEAAPRPPRRPAPGRGPAGRGGRAGAGAVPGGGRDAGTRGRAERGERGERGSRWSSR